MSRKNLTVAGLVTAAFTVVLLTFALRPATNGTTTREVANVAVPNPAPTSALHSAPNPSQEKSLKKSSLSQDVDATDHLNRVDVSRHLTKLLSETDGMTSLHDKSVYAKRLQQNHGFITMLMWIDFRKQKRKPLSPLHFLKEPNRRISSCKNILRRRNQRSMVINPMNLQRLQSVRRNITLSLSGTKKKCRHHCTY